MFGDHSVLPMIKVDEKKRAMMGSYLKWKACSIVYCGVATGIEISGLALKTFYKDYKFV